MGEESCSKGANYQELTIMLPAPRLSILQQLLLCIFTESRQPDRKACTCSQLRDAVIKEGVYNHTAVSSALTASVQRRMRGQPSDATSMY